MSNKNFRRNFVALTLILWTNLCSMGQCPDIDQNPTIIINEVSQGAPGSTSEFIELLVIGQGIIDLEGYILDDNNFADFHVGNESGHIRFGTCLSDLKSGTIILIYDDTEIANAPIATSEFVKVIPFSSECLVKYGKSPNLHNSQYSSQGINTNLNGSETIALRNLGDCAQVRLASGASVSAICWGGVPFNGLVNFAFQDHVIGKTIIFQSEESEYKVLPYLQSSPGKPNNEINREFINSNRHTPGQNGEFALHAFKTSNDNGLTKGSIQLEIINGKSPFTLNSNIEIYEEGNLYYFNVSGTEERLHSVLNVNCGEYKIEVIDSDGCAASFYINMELVFQDKYPLLDNSCFTLSINEECLGLHEPCSYLWTPSDGLSDPKVLNPEFCLNLSESNLYNLTIIGEDGNFILDQNFNFSLQKDTDNDGVFDHEDCDINNYLKFGGAPCDDADPCTREDQIDPQTCECIGEEIPGCSENCDIGAPCDDGNPCTSNDKIDEDCMCVGDQVDDCEPCAQGSPCDDGNPCTGGDIIRENCQCSGEVILECEECIVDRPCDDGNPCTINDKFNKNCKCIGVSKVAPEISFSQNSDCTNKERTISVNGSFNQYIWSKSGVILSNLPELVTKEPGDYDVTVRDFDGCLSNLQFTLDDFGKSIDINIGGSLPFCNSTNDISLSVAETYKNVVWENNRNELSYGNSISPVTAAFYKVTAQNQEDCQVQGQVRIEEVLSNIELHSDKDVLCIGGSANVELSNLPSDISSIVWSAEIPNPEDNPESIIVSESGNYSVTITDSQDCETIKNIEIRDKEDVDIVQVLIDNGFTQRQVIINQVFTSAKQDNDLRNSICNFNSSENLLNYELFIIEDGTTTIDLDLLCAEKSSMSQCDLDFGLYYYNSSCELNLDEFLNASVSHQDGALLAYLEPGEEGETSTLFTRMDEYIIPATFEKSDIATTEFLNLLCAVNQDVEYQLENTRIGRNTVARPMELFDGNVYNGLKLWEDFYFGGIGFQNYKVGETLDLSAVDFSSYNPETKNWLAFSIFSEEKNGESIVGSNFSYNIIKIPYISDCNDKLILLVSTPQYDNFIKLFYEGNQIAKNFIYANISDNEFFTRVSKLPLCLLNDNDICDLLSSEKFLQPSSFNISKLAFYELLDLASGNKSSSSAIIECFKNKKLVVDYIMLYRNHIGYVSNSILLFEKLIQSFNQNVTPLGLAFYEGLKKDEIFNPLHFSGISLGAANISHSISYTDDYFSFQLTQHFPSDPDDWQSLFPIKHRISSGALNYFDSYPVYVDKHFKFVSENRTNLMHDNESYFLEVPGIYVPYAILKQDKNQLISDAFATLDASSIAFGFGTLSAAMKVSRAKKLLLLWRKTVGYSEITAGFSHLLLDNSTFCENLHGATSEICEAYKNVLPYLEILLLSGDIVVNFAKASKQTDEFLEKVIVELDDMSSGGGRERIQSAFGDNFDDFETVVRSVASLKRQQLEEAYALVKAQYPNTYGEIFDKLELFSDAEFQKILSLSDDINLLGVDNAFELLRDITATRGIAGTVGSSVLEIDGKMVKAWDLARRARGANSLWKTDIPLLTKLTELSEDLTFMQRIGGDEGLEKILKANVRARCKSCGNAGATFLKHIDEYLDDVKHFVDNYHGIDGFDDVLKDLKLLNSSGSPNFNMEGASFMLRVMKSNESTYLGKVTKFEGSIDDLINGCRYDLTFTNGNITVFGEYKSYDLNSLSNLLATNSATLQQFVTYLGKINSLDELPYLFDIEKISDLSVIKNRFKNVFDNNDGLFDAIYANSSLRNNLLNNPTSEVQALQRFDNLVSELDNPNIMNPLLYSFINSY